MGLMYRVFGFGRSVVMVFDRKYCNNIVSILLQCCINVST